MTFVKEKNIIVEDVSIRKTTSTYQLEVSIKMITLFYFKIDIILGTIKYVMIIHNDLIVFKINNKIL